MNNSKNDKTDLKKAREYLMQKNFKEAVKICKRILKHDENNYGALIIIAAALQETNDLRVQALPYLKKAINLQPENPLAWKGLVCYYEKETDNADTWRELIPAYCKVLLYDNESIKVEHYLSKCSALLLNLNEDQIFEETISSFRSFYETYSQDESKLMLLNGTLASLLTSYPNVSSTHDDLLKRALSGVLSKGNISNRENYYKRYLKLLYKLKNYDLQLEEAVKMHNLYPQNSYPLEWICRTFTEQVILHDKCKDFKITLYHETLLKKNKNSYFAWLAKAVDMYIQESYISCRDILTYIVSIKVLLTAWILLIKVNKKLYSWELVEAAAIEAEKIISTNEDKSMEEFIKLSLIESMIRSNKKSKWEAVMQKYMNFIDNESPKHLLLLARLYILMEKPEAVIILNKLEKYNDFKADVAILKAIQLYQQSRLEEAVDILESALDTSEAWILMGKIYWKLNDYGHSHMAFLKGVHADSNNWECLTYLGHYYKDHGNDIERSRKCYQKALQINPNSDDAGFNLSIVYSLMKDDDGNLQLLEQMTSESNGPKWAWFQLGLLKLERGDPQEAIKCLRNVIRLYPNDSNSWETLADAYFARGAFTSAMKSYQKVLELNSESFYSMMQVAHIKMLLSQYEEAKEEYEKVIERKKDNVVALKGLAETHLGLARSQINNQRLERASSNIQIAVDHLVSIVTKRNEFSCVWKLLGNACYLMATIPERYCSLLIPHGLIISGSRITDTQVEIKKQDILTLSVRSYCRALNLTKESPFIWHDLAMSYLTQIQEDPSIDKTEAVARSLSAIKYAIRLSPTTWYHWNLLGVICMNENVMNYALAQHCFVTAIELEHNNPVAWTNLGSLYLKLDDFSKANNAFTCAQRNEPAYVNSWIGQAIIAEQVGSGEAMDLFRHSTQITYHPQGALGYAHWVIQTLLDPKAKNNPSYTYSIVNMYALPVATDCITWYIVHHPNDVCALNISGLLLERQKMYKSAEESFSQALKYAEDDTERDYILINLARVCVQLKDYDRAIKLCTDVKEANFKSHGQLAIALFKAERYQESYSTYEVILEWLADTDSQKGHVLCAMAAMAYMFESIDAVKTLLFQCIDFKPRIVSGLLAAAALSILHDDQNLSNLILKELEIFKDDEKYRHQIALLSAFYAMKLDGLQAAIRTLTKIIHQYPGDAKLWTVLVKFLVKSESEYILTCALKSVFLGRDTNEPYISKIASIASYSEMKNNPSIGIKSVLKMVHAFPGCIDNWATLIAALLIMHGSDSYLPSIKWISTLTSIVKKELPCSREMEQWLLNNEKYTTELSSKIEIDSV